MDINLILKNTHPLFKVILLTSFISIFFTSNIYVIILICFAFISICFSIKSNPLDNNFLIIFLLVLFSISFGYGYYYSHNYIMKSLLDSSKLVLQFFIIIGSGIIYTKFVSPSEIIFLFRKLLPQKSPLIIPLLVAFRIMPLGVTITQNVFLAQKARGIVINRFNLKNIKRFFSTFMVAYFASFIDILFNFSTTIYMRGINNNRGTIYKHYSLRWFDILIALYFILLLFFLMNNAFEMPY